jgi:hypothetical protein
MLSIYLPKMTQEHQVKLLSICQAYSRTFKPGMTSNSSILRRKVVTKKILQYLLSVNDISKKGIAVRKWRVCSTPRMRVTHVPSLGDPSVTASRNSSGLSYPMQ